MKTNNDFNIHRLKWNKSLLHFFVEMCSYVIPDFSNNVQTERNIEFYFIFIYLFIFLTLNTRGNRNQTVRKEGSKDD